MAMFTDDELSSLLSCSPPASPPKARPDGGLSTCNHQKGALEFRDLLCNYSAGLTGYHVMFSGADCAE